MSLFQDIVLAWDGQDYLVKSSQVMGLIETVESVVTLEDLTSNKINRSLLSRAYSLALIYAGCLDATQEGVYAVFFDPEKSKDVQEVINGLLTLMIPPKHLQRVNPSTKPPKKKPARKKKQS